MNRQFHNFVFRLHTWLGLHLSLFLAFLFLTGSVLVIAPELELAFRPNVWTAMPEDERVAKFSMIHDAVMANDPSIIVSVIEKHPGTWLASKVHIRTVQGGGGIVWADPASGTIVDTTRTFGFRTILKDLHDNLLVDHRIAYLLVSGVSVLLLVLILTGLMSYRRFWKGFFRRPSDQSGQRAWLGSLHRLLAIWSFPTFLIIALSGSVFFLGGLGIAGHTPTPAPAQARTVVLPENFNADRIDRAEIIARAALPGFNPTVMVPPRKVRDGIVFIGPQSSASTLLGDARVSVDPVTMEVLGAFRPSDNAGLARIRPLIEKLHFGTWGGIFSKLLWVILGLTGFGVALSGMLTFAARQASPAEGASNPGALRLVWQGLRMFRWVYGFLVLGIIMASIYHYISIPEWRDAAQVQDASGLTTRLEPGRPQDTALTGGQRKLP